MGSCDCQFITVVKEGRGKRLKESPEIFSGLIWTGQRSVDLGLADGFGSLEYVAREVIKAEEIRDYTITEGVASRIARRFGAAAANSIVDALLRVSIRKKQKDCWAPADHRLRPPPGLNMQCAYGFAGQRQIGGDAEFGLWLTRLQQRALEFVSHRVPPRWFDRDRHPRPSSDRQGRVKARLTGPRRPLDAGAGAWLQ